MTHLIGICGGSGSGKTTLAERVLHGLGPERATLLSFDTYYRDLSHLALAERAASNLDHPDILDVDLFVEHLDLLAAGEPAPIPVYDFVSYSRIPETVERLEPRPVVVVEGILLFAFPQIVERLDLRVYRECPEHIRLARRRHRDITERGRTPESVDAQFAATVAPMHDRFVAPSRAQADLIIEHGERDIDAITTEVLVAIEQTLEQPTGAPASDRSVLSIS